MRGRSILCLLALALPIGCSSGSSGGAREQGAGEAGVTDSSVVDGPAADVEGPEAGVRREDGGAGGDAGEAVDAGDAALHDAEADAGNGCAYEGAPGTCISVSECASMTGYSSFAGYCPGPASIECCIVTPSTADNPPVPAGWVLMQQSQVTSAMTTWAVMILDDPTSYPMFSTAFMTFGGLLVMARVEWHPPDFNNNAIHRGVTLYEQAD
jgi:hypothetical protein